MTKRAERTIFSPMSTADFAQGEDKLIFWKQILPKAPVHYIDNGTKRLINFDDEYLRDCVKAFRKKEGIDQTMFQLANSENGHGHDFDPERQRAEVIDMATYDELPPEVREKVGGSDGLYAKMRFFDKKAARVVMQNPNLGVSARVRENFPRWDGKVVKRAIIHVAGTIDPKVSGMSPWAPADLSYDPKDGYVLDLSNETFEGNRMAGKSKERGNAIPTDEEIDAMSDEELDAFLADSGLSDAELDELEGSLDDLDDTDDDDDLADAPAETVGASLSNDAQQAIDLANAQAAEANRRALNAQKRQAKAEFAAYRSELIGKGVPVEKIDLAQPVLARPENALVVDLSNTDDGTLDVSKIVRELLEGYAGVVDMTGEQGHNGTVDFANGDDDPESELLEAWDTQYPTTFGL